MPPTTAEIIAAAHVVVDIPVAWGEMDALNHVNNVSFFRYLETSRVAFLRALGPGVGFDASDRRRGVGFILQHAECRFRRPVNFPDTLRVTSSLVSIGDDRFTLEHQVISTATDHVAAVGRGTIVTYDYAAHAKVSIPPVVRDALARFPVRAPE